MLVLRVLLGVVISLALTWVIFLVVLAVFRPRGMNLAEARQFVPDLARLLKDMSVDPTVPKGVRRRLGLLLIYLASPLDLVPDFLPVIGYVDDVILIALVLRSAVRRAGAGHLERHWRGTPAGLALVRQAVGLD